MPDDIVAIADIAFCYCVNLASITLPDGLCNIGDGAFAECSALTNMMIPASVTNVGDFAFQDCVNLLNIHFAGNPPEVNASAFFEFDFYSGSYEIPAIIYFVSSATGWSNSLAGLPTKPWLPAIQIDINYAVDLNAPAFEIDWASGQTVVVDACTNLANPRWQSVHTNTLTGGTSYFSDPQWTNYTSRFYRLRSP
jgi:hypothetical protein